MLLIPNAFLGFEQKIELGEYTTHPLLLPLCHLLAVVGPLPLPLSQLNLTVVPLVRMGHLTHDLVLETPTLRQRLVPLLHHLCLVKLQQSATGLPPQSAPQVHPQFLNPLLLCISLVTRLHHLALFWTRMWVCTKTGGGSVLLGSLLASFQVTLHSLLLSILPGNVMFNSPCMILVG